jgi:hypothetical protein
VINLAANITPRAGYDPTVIDTEIRRRLAVFFGDIDDPTPPFIPLGVGKDVMTSQLLAVVMGVPGVYSLEGSAPPDNVIIAPNQVPELGTITLIMEAPSYE